MKDWAPVERLMNAIPRIPVTQFPPGSPVPKIRSVKPLIEYNGFCGHSRMRTWEVVKWLMSGERMPFPSECDLCGNTADQYHAENYFDFATYIPICRSCHGKVHGRLRNFATFERRREEWGKARNHWVYFVGEHQLPMAQWCEAAGQSEPTFQDFVPPLIP